VAAGIEAGLVMSVDWSTVWHLVSSQTAQKIYAAFGGAAAVILNTWWNRRDYYQASVDWRNVNTVYGPEYVPVITIVNTSEKPLSVTNVRMYDGWRRHLDAYPFDSEDPDYPSLPRIVAKGESTIFTLSSDLMGKAVERSGGIVAFLHLPRVYLGVRTMGRGWRYFVGEPGLTRDVKWKRYR